MDVGTTYIGMYDTMDDCQRHVAGCGSAQAGLAKCGFLEEWDLWVSPRWLRWQGVVGAGVAGGCRRGGGRGARGDVCLCAHARGSREGEGAHRATVHAMVGGDLR